MNVTQLNENLIEMTKSFVDQSYMMKLLTTRAFSNKFKTCQDQATKLLDKIQVLISAQNLEIAHSTQVAISIMTKRAKNVTIECDEKLDEIILGQQQMKDSIERHHSVMESKLHMLASQRAEKFTFKIGGEVTIKKGWFNWVPFVKGVTTKCKPFTSIRNISATPIVQDDILSKKEWEWMNQQIQATLKHKLKPAYRMKSNEDVMESLTEKLIDAINSTKEQLKFKDRALQLKSQDMHVETKIYRTRKERREAGTRKRQTTEFTAELMFLYPPTGPIIPSSELMDSVVSSLPVVQPIKKSRRFMKREKARSISRNNTPSFTSREKEAPTKRSIFRGKKKVPTKRSRISIWMDCLTAWM